jgi:hypothetical protein
MGEYVAINPSTVIKLADRACLTLRLDGEDAATWALPQPLAQVTELRGSIR